MKKKGINLSGYVYELPLHKQPVFPENNNDVLPNTEYLCNNHICLPIYPSLKNENAEFIAQQLIKMF